MKIKEKLYLGVGTLFAIILTLMMSSILFINKLQDDTRNILVANYNTLDYSRKMEIALNNDIAKPENAAIFLENLELQRKNITEPGEEEFTGKLADHFKALQQNSNDPALIHQIRQDISAIMLLNMQAIQRKSKVAQDTAAKSIFWLSLLGSICFIIAITMLFNLPGNIANPIKEITESIKEIAGRNYSKRIHFQNQDEFGEMAASFNSMAEKLEEYQASNLQKLMIEKKRIETLINNMNDPVIGLDENRKILFMNNIALKISGLKEEVVTGKPIQDIAVKNDLIRSLIQDLFSDRQDLSGKKETIKIYADDKESYFEKEIIPINIIPTGEKTEKQMGNVIFLQNITPYKELDFAKTNFIAIVSHELKTPISSIKLSLELLKNENIGQLNEEQKNLAQSIQDDAERLLKITAELLNMAQVETGSMQLYTSSVSPTDIVEYAINSNRVQAESKNIIIKPSITDGIANVLADKEKTAWVLTNLISNAIRYSYDNSDIFIDVHQDGDKVCFSVKDTGQGIAPQYIDRVFDRYFRIPGTKKEGTGLGLSISKEFIEAQGGFITVKSEYAAGSTFSVYLPVAKV